MIPLTEQRLLSEIQTQVRCGILSPRVETALSAILARVERLEGALKFYAHEWKWFPVGGENPTESHPGSPPEGYEAEPTAALIKDGGDRAHRALAVLSPKPEGRSNGS